VEQDTFGTFIARGRVLRGDAHVTARDVLTSVGGEGDAIA
jgi:hypothetical protein